MNNPALQFFDPALFHSAEHAVNDPFSRLLGLEARGKSRKLITARPENDVTFPHGAVKRRGDGYLKFSMILSKSSTGMGL